MNKRYREQAEHAWTADSVRLIPTPSAFAKSALYYVQEIGRFRTLPSYYTKRERLDSFLIVYTTAGWGWLNYRDQTYELNAGSVFFIDCMDYQDYRPADPSEPWDMLWVHLNGQSSRAYFERYWENDNNPVNLMPAGSRVPDILLELLEVHQSRSIRNELAASKLLMDLLTELLLARTVSDTLEEEWPAYIAECAQLIERRYAENLNLDRLARSCAVNKYHLAKEFKRYIGLSPGEYIIGTRISRAKELLKSTELPVSDIAERVGIDNVSHFINLFKDRVDLTPLKYRKYWRDSNG